MHRTGMTNYLFARTRAYRGKTIDKSLRRPLKRTAQRTVAKKKRFPLSHDKLLWLGAIIDGQIAGVTIVKPFSNGHQQGSFFVGHAVFWWDFRRLILFSNYLWNLFYKNFWKLNWTKTFQNKKKHHIKSQSTNFNEQIRQRGESNHRSVYTYEVHNSLQQSKAVPNVIRLCGLSIPPKSTNYVRNDC